MIHFVFFPGILEGGTKSDRTVKKDDENWKVTKMFTKTGLVIVETSTFYEKRNSNPKKYGHRKPFSWETQEEIGEHFKVDSNTYEVPKYFLNNIDETLVYDIRKYIMAKDPFEEAKMDRECNVEKLSEETIKQYEGVMHFLNEQFQGVLDEMSTQFCTTLNFQKTHTVMLDTVLENQEEAKIATTEISTTLENIQQTVEQTAGHQIALIDRTAEIQGDMDSIRESQTEMLERQNELRRVVEERSLGNEVRQILKENDPAPKIKAEAKRFQKKLKKLGF